MNQSNMNREKRENREIGKDRVSPFVTLVGHEITAPKKISRWFTELLLHQLHHLCELFFSLFTEHGSVAVRSFSDSAVEAQFKLWQRNPDSGVVLPVPIVGVIDLVERDGTGRITVVDFKTAARSYHDSKVRQDLQLTLYSEVVKHSKLATGESQVACRFDVLLKTKKPALVSYPTIRTDEDRRRLFKIINEILHAFEAGIYYPNQGWACDNC